MSEKTVPAIDSNREEELLVSNIYRDKLTDAMRVLSRVADAKTMQRVPIGRIATPLDTWTKIKISARRFLPGFLVGAAGYLGSVVLPLVAASGFGTLGIGTLVAAVGYGVLGGLGLGTSKYVRETRKDIKLDKEVRSLEVVRAEGYNEAQMEYIAKIISIVMQLTQAGGLNTQAALKQVYVSLDLLGPLPYEIGQFLLTLSTVVEDGSARGGFTAAEIQSVLKEAHDIRDAAERLRQRWNER